MSSFQSLRVKIFADGADRAGMIEMAGKPHIAGLTTNPTLMRKAGIVDYRAFAQDVLKPEGASLIVVGDGKLFVDALKAKAPNLEVIPIAQFDPDNASLRGSK